MHIISGKFKGRKLIAPKGEKTARPTSGIMREALFNICQSYIQDAHFLDLFAGTGAIGFEALSRGAASVTFVENFRESLRCIQQNVQNLTLEDQAQILYGDVFKTIDKLANQGKQYDIIYADPPYSTYQIVEEVKVSYSHFVIQLIDKGTLLKPDGVLFIEEAKEMPPYAGPLLTLQLKNSRHMGKSMLWQYGKKQEINQ